jgi:hypothetical protein
MSGLMKQRWLWLVGLFALINGTGWWMVNHQVANDRRLDVVRVSLDPGDLLVAPLQVEFSQQMVTAEQIGTPVHDGWLSLDPLVAGQWEWSDVRVAQLRLDEPLNPATAVAEDGA